MEGGAGNDVLSGGSGADVFILGPGFGNDRITDFRSDDVLDWSAMTAAGISVTTSQSGRDTLVSFSDRSSILLEKVSSRDLGSDWFIDQSASAGHPDWMLAA